MSCRKAYELDLAGFLADPTGAVWAPFRDHYPRCDACAAEVRAWTDLHLALGRDAHPAPEDLVRFVDEPAAVAPPTRHAIAEHLAACAACRDEAHALRTLDPLAEPRPTRAATASRRAGGALARVLWHPGFAYAVAVAIGLYPLLTGRVAPPSLRSNEKKTTSTAAKPATPPAAPPAVATQPAPSPPATRAEPLDVEMNDLMKQQTPHAAAPAGAPVEGDARAKTRELAAASANEPEPRRRDEARQESAVKDSATKDDGAAAMAETARGAVAPPEIVVSPDKETAASIAAGGGDVLVRVAGVTHPVMAIVVVDDSGGRYLREKRTGERWAVIRLPSRWLTPGLYRIEVVPVDADGSIVRADLRIR